MADEREAASVLRVVQGGVARELPFAGRPLLCDVLLANGYSASRPCGGRGVCGKCAVSLTGAVSPANEAERRAGARLSCQAVLLGDCEAILPEPRALEQIAVDGPAPDMVKATAGAPEDARLGAAIDVGTTTLALRLLSLADGRTLATAATRNPQTSVAADVMGRISAALSGEGKLLQRQATDAIAALLDEACMKAGCSRAAVERLVVTGNTTMLYLLTGRAPTSLARAPFSADCLFDEEAELLGLPAYYPPCMHAFVGADTTCAALAVNLCDAADTTLLCDIGTNGEMALWKDGTLRVASAAAGPAFEGAGITMGCGSVRGAIDHVWAEGSALSAHTVGDAPAVGVCGSGLLDALAALLQQEHIDATGATDEAFLPLRDGVGLYPQDIRSVQLAKAAIAAGIRVLLAEAGASARDVRRLFIAGGFGSRLRLSSAAAVGLIPAELVPRAQAVGNAALAGAAELLLHPERAQDARRLARAARHVNLGGNARFGDAFVECMRFP